MATLTRQDMVEAGLLATYAACAGGGDVVDNADGLTFLHVKNGSGGSITVTVTAQVAAFQTPGMGPMTKANVAVAIGAAAEKFLGPFAKQAFNTAAGQLAITYSAVTSLTIAAVRLPKANL